MTPFDLRRYRAERLLRKDFEGMRGKVLTVVRSQLRSAGIGLAAADLEACYSEAWHGLYASVLGGEQIENPAGWLVRVTFRRAIDEVRTNRATPVGEGGEGGSYASPSHASPDLAGGLEDKARLRQLFEGLRLRLSPREREAVSLCYLQGLTRAQAAERMGLSEARMRKLMEGAGAGRPGVAAKMSELLGTIAAGGWCEEQGSLMRAYAFGILDPEGERYPLAVAHCKECPGCRAHVACLRGLASVLPLPLLPELTAAGSGVAARAGAKASGVKASSGFLGSLTAKLALTGVVVLGTSYAVLSSRAHGGTPAPSAPVGSSPGTLVSGALVPATLVPYTPIPGAAARPVLSKPLRPEARMPHRAAARGRSSPLERPRSKPSTGATGRVPAYEFGPERVAGQPSATRPSSSSGAGEFGLE